MNGNRFIGNRTSIGRATRTLNYIRSCQYCSFDDKVDATHGSIADNARGPFAVLLRKASSVYYLSGHVIEGRYLPKLISQINRNIGKYCFAHNVSLVCLHQSYHDGRIQLISAYSCSQQISGLMATADHLFKDALVCRSHILACCQVISQVWRVLPGDAAVCTDTPIVHRSCRLSVATRMHVLQ